MSAVAVPKPSGLALLLRWQRIVFAVCAAVLVWAPLSVGWKSGPLSLLERTLMLAFAGLLAFGVFEQWPRRLPDWLARWVVQVLAVATAMPVTTLAFYVLSTDPGAPPFWMVPDRLQGFVGLTALGVLLAPWAALAALVRQKDALARHQALALDLQRSEFERQALDARLNLLQAQVAPHFLFNTLANVQALVDAGSPQAPAVLRSLIAYLRAAVPRLHEAARTLDQELQLVQAYLELMHMRMPDRLTFALHVDDAARALRCPPTTLLTLVENAVRHGIDPSEDGGRIDIDVRIVDGRCRVRVSDSGAGLRDGSVGLGTGLATLRERLQLIFRGDASLQVRALEPHGTCAELDFPAERAGDR